MQAIEIEREAAHLLPRLLEDLLDEDGIGVEREEGFDRGSSRVDICLRDSRDRRWLVEVKSSSGPGHIKVAAKQLAELAGRNEDGIPVLLVPHMSSAGAKTARKEHLNWIDFAGNASIDEEGLRIYVRGRKRVHPPRGRPASAFAPRSARIARQLLLHPGRWWRQRDLAEVTRLNDGTVSRVVQRLNEELLLEYSENMVRAREPDLLLDAWADDYRFDKHDIVEGHMSGTGVELARSISAVLSEEDVHHAFTGLPAAWVIDAFAQFRLTTVFVDGDPREAAEALHLRRYERGANVQLVGPNDSDIFVGGQSLEGLSCVSAVQTYLDLQHLPERAKEAADHLRAHHLDWNAN